MDIFQFSEAEILAFILVLIRVSVFFTLWPVFGVNTVPTYAKILTSVAVSLLLFPSIEWQSLASEITTMAIVGMVFREAFISLILTFVARTLFYAVNVCGQLVSVSIGLSSAEVLNPAMDNRASAIEQFQVMAASLMFLAWNGHHIFLEAMAESYTLLPLSVEMVGTISAESLMLLLQGLVVVGVKLSAPVIACIFFANVALGLAGRAVPQINILITSFPANILMGFFILLLTLPAFFMGFKHFVNETGYNLFAILKSI